MDKAVQFRDKAVHIDGKPVFLFSGEIQNFRLSPDQWEDRLEKAKALGLNCVGTYFGWNFHAPAPDRVDFSSPERDIGRFMDICAKLGLYVIVRPGPYICNEWDLGGYPGWLLAESAGDWRTGEPQHLDWCRRWYSQVNRQLAPRQQGRGGSVVLYQVENEHFWGDRELLDGLGEQAHKDGITVPLVTNGGGSALACGSKLVTEGMDVYTDVYEYCRWRGWFDRLYRQLPADAPLLMLEFRSATVSMWGETIPNEQKLPASWPQTTAQMFTALGANVVNFFISIGGSTPVGFGSDHICTSYGADAAITPWGGLSELFYLIRLMSQPIAAFNAQLAAAKPWPLNCTGRVNAWGTDNYEVEGLARIGEAGKFLWAINQSAAPQSFTFVLPGGRRLPEDAPLRIPPRTAQLYVAEIEIGENVKLEFSTAQVLNRWQTGHRISLAVHAEHDAPGYAIFHVNGARKRIAFTCTDAGERHLLACGEREIELIAVSTETARRTWFVQQDGQTIPLIGNLELVRPTRDAEGMIRAEAVADQELRLATPTYAAIEINGTRHELRKGKNGLRELRVNLPVPAALEVHPGEPEFRVESDSWTTEECSPETGWRQLDSLNDPANTLLQTGYYQYRTDFEITGALPATLELTSIMGVEATVFLNGVKLGVFPKDRSRPYHELPAHNLRLDVQGVVRMGRNALAVACNLIGRHNSGRPLLAGPNGPVLLYTTRHEEPLTRWLESPLSRRRWLSSELQTIPAEISAGEWREVELSTPRDYLGADTGWCSVRWYRTRCSIPEHMRGKPLLLKLPSADEMWLYVNGEKIGYLGVQQEKVFNLSACSQQREIELCLAIRQVWKGPGALLRAPMLVAADQMLEDRWQRRAGSQGERENWLRSNEGWRPVVACASATRAWYRQRFTVRRPQGVVAPLYVEMDNGWRNHAVIYWNEQPIGMYANCGPDRRFYITDGLLREENTLTVALDGHGAQAEPGRVCLGSYYQHLPLTLKLAVEGNDTHS